MRRRVCSLLFFLVIPVQISSIEPSSTSHVIDSNEDTLDLCQSYRPAQEKICRLIISLVREGSAAVGIELQNAIDNETNNCTNDKKRLKLIISNKSQLLENALAAVSQAIENLNTRKNELETHLILARVENDAIQQKLLELMLRSSAQTIIQEEQLVTENETTGRRNNSQLVTEKRQLEAQLVMSQKSVFQIESVLAAVMREKYDLMFIHKRVTLQNDALNLQMQYLNQSKPQSNEMNACLLERDTIIALENELAKKRSQLENLRAENSREIDITSFSNLSLQKERELKVQLESMNIQLELSQQRENELKSKLENATKRETLLETELTLAKEREREQNYRLEQANLKEIEMMEKLKLIQQNEIQLKSKSNSAIKEISRMKLVLDIVQKNAREKEIEMNLLLEQSEKAKSESMSQLQMAMRNYTGMTEKLKEVTEREKLLQNHLEDSKLRENQWKSQRSMILRQNRGIAMSLQLANEREKEVNLKLKLLNERFVVCQSLLTLRETHSRAIDIKLSVCRNSLENCTSAGEMMRQALSNCSHYQGNGTRSYDDSNLLNTNEQFYGGVTVDTVKLPTGEYLFINESRNWTDAREHCQSYEMDLVTIDTAEENRAVAAYGKALTDWWRFTVWTSGCYSDIRGGWTWYSTDVPVTYTNWYQGNGYQRSESNCIIINAATSLWYEFPASSAFYFVCEKNSSANATSPG